MQILQNVVSPSSPSDAVLSQGLPKQTDKVLATELETFDQVHDRQHVRQQRRVRQPELVQHEPFQTQFDPLRQGGRRGLIGQRRRETRILRWPAVKGWGTALTPGIEALLLLSSRGRLIVGDTPLARPLPAMMLAATERTTQVRAADVPGMGEKANPAVNAGNDASLQFGMRLDGTVQRHQILLDQRPGAIVLMPIRPKREELADGDDKKAKFSATIPMTLCTPSSYLTEANASPGRARFFCALQKARAHSRNQRPNPHRPPSQFCSPAATLPHSRRAQTTTWKKKPLLLPK